MATPVPDSYSAASGVAIYGGRLAPSSLWAGDIVIVGDSITDPGYASNSFNWMFGKTRKSLRVLRNAGVYGNTIQNLIDRFDADVIAKAPHYCSVRIGTNSLGLNASAFEAQYQQLLDKLEAANIFGIIHAITPIGASGAVPIARNDMLKAKCAAKPTKLFFVDDCLTICDANYVPLAEAYAADLIHPNALGAYRMGSAAAAIIGDRLAPVDLLVDSMTDIYPANPASNQYVGNPFFTGTNGTFFYASGVMPTGWGLSTSGGTGTLAVSSIVPADAGDLNQHPWLRVALNGSSAGLQGVGVGCTLQHPAFAADGSLQRLDCAVELRFNNLDTSKLTKMTMTAQNGGGAMIGEQVYYMGVGTLNESVIFRSSTTRAQTTVATNFIRFGVGATFGSAFSGSIGSFDIRCPTVRGQAT